MDRKAWIVIIACVASLGMWQWAYMKYYAPTPAQVAEAKRVAAETSPAVPAAPAPAATVAPAAPAPVAAPPAANEPSVPRQEFRISTKLADFLFVSDAGGIAAAELLGHLGENGANVFLNIPEALPIGAISDQPGQPLGGFVRAASAAPNEAIFTKTSADGLQIRKVFRVEEAGGEGNYAVKLALEFANPGAAPVQRPGFFVSMGGASPVHYGDMSLYTGFDWYRDGKATFTDVNWFNASSIPLTGIQLSAAKEFYEEKTDHISWAAVKNQYFATIVVVEQGDPGTAVWARKFDLMHGGDTARPVLGLEGALGLPGFRLDAGQTKSWNLQIYAGPKDLGRLSKLGHGEQEVMHFGVFKWVSEILLYSMNALHSVLGNFAAAIIVLTIIIKSLLWPLQNKATGSMRKMAALSPKMTELREKYKDDPTKMNQELMKL
ncbi:MAG: membrane protein insertase YidC, partial [Chthoniobacterales bacterium]|nr:membrane protein insertase YidC [Chthoniobacterales bacterium]